MAACWLSSLAFLADDTASSLVCFIELGRRELDRARVRASVRASVRTRNKTRVVTRVRERVRESVRERVKERVRERGKERLARVGLAWIRLVC